MTVLSRSLLIAAAAATLVVVGGCGRHDAPTSPPAAGAEPVAETVELVWGNDWDAALARAAREQRPVVVVFTAEWCLWCRRLESATFTDRAVRAALAGAVLVDLDVDHVSVRQRVVSLGVDGPPTTVVLAPSGVERGRILGYLPPEEYLPRLTQLLTAS